MTKKVKTYTGVKTVSSTSGFGKAGQIYAKNETGPLFYTIYKNKLKNIKSSHVRP